MGKRHRQGTWCHQQVVLQERHGLWAPVTEQSQGLGAHAGKMASRCHGCGGAEQVGQVLLQSE